MPSSIRPNYASFPVDGSTPPEDFQIIGYAYQPVPDQLQSATVIRLPIMMLLQFGQQEGIVTLGCWEAAWDDVELMATSRRIGDLYTIGLPEVGGEGDVTIWPAELIWIDTAVQQSGAYIVAVDPTFKFDMVFVPASVGDENLRPSLTTVSP